MYWKLINSHKSLMFFLLIFHTSLTLITSMRLISSHEVVEEEFFCRHSLTLWNATFIILNLPLLLFSLKAFLKNQTLLTLISFYEKTSSLFILCALGGVLPILMKFLPDYLCRLNSLGIQESLIMSGWIVSENIMLLCYVRWF